MVNPKRLCPAGPVSAWRIDPCICKRHRGYGAKPEEARWLYLRIGRNSNWAESGTGQNPRCGPYGDWTGPNWGVFTGVATPTSSVRVFVRKFGIHKLPLASIATANGSALWASI